MSGHIRPECEAAGYFIEYLVGYRIFNQIYSRIPDISGIVRHELGRTSEPDIRSIPNVKGIGDQGYHISADISHNEA